jgi:sugar lactone lactonase YvrE
MTSSGATADREPSNKVELAFAAGDELGEGVTWDHARRRVISVDIMRGRIHIFDPASGTARTLTVDQPVGTAVPCQSGGLMLALRDGFARLDTDAGALTWVAHVELDRPGQRMNDGACDAAGRFWAGTMCMQERPGLGSLYRLDPDGTVHTMLTDVGISNGIDWSLDGSRMYYVDSLVHRIDQFDFDLGSGRIANRRPFVTIDPADGYPDGLTVDAEGGIWLALWGGWAVRRYLPDGTLDRVLRVPVSHPTTCTFGGDDLASLYITSATIRLTETERLAQPLAGAVIRHRPGVTGRPAHAFAG